MKNNMGNTDRIIRVLSAAVIAVLFINNTRDSSKVGVMDVSFEIRIGQNSLNSRKCR